ncbi:uncharacterized protein [Palaemon carinicauda]|uniref:uncharacterized protein n=1 Tax=Palaemon carinicauda TaxID=392227 RepID=UPI0035B5AE84
MHPEHANEGPMFSQTVDESDRDAFITGSVHCVRETAPPSPSISPGCSLEKGQDARSGLDPYFREDEVITDLVEGQHQPQRGSAPDCSDPQPRSLLGRIGHGLGCDIRRSGMLGHLELGAKSVTYQLQGATGSSSGLEKLQVPPSRQGGGGELRQHHGLGVHLQARRDPFYEVVRDRKGPPHLVKRSKPVSSNEVHSRQHECHGGPPQSEGSNHPNRMDPSQECMQETLGHMGPTYHRSLCNLNDQEAPKLLLANPGPSSSSYRCFSTGLVPSRPLCIPPVQDCQQGTAEVRLSRRDKVDVGCSPLARERMVHRGTAMAGGRSQNSSAKSGPSTSATRKEGTPKPPRSSSDCLQTIERLSRARGFSKEAARAIARARRTSTLRVYQSKWEVFRSWCKSVSVSSTSTSVTQIADFLLYLRKERSLSAPTIKGYRSMLAAVFRHRGLDLSNNKDLQDLLKSFETSKERRLATPGWNLDVVLRFLMSERFEPLQSASFKDLTLKTLFLVCLATAKRVSEIHAFSRNIGFSSETATCSLQLGFLAKNELPSRPWPKSFDIPSLSNLVGNEVERVLCPVRALKFYLKRTKPLRGQSEALWCAIKKPSLPMSKNAVSYYIRLLIREAHSHLNEEDHALLKVRTHEVRAVATSVAFKQNRSLQSIMDATYWRSKSVFASFYLKDVQSLYENCYTLGPFVAASAVVGEGSTTTFP